MVELSLDDERIRRLESCTDHTHSPVTSEEA